MNNIKKNRLLTAAAAVLLFQIQTMNCGLSVSAHNESVQNSISDSKNTDIVLAERVDFCLDHLSLNDLITCEEMAAEFGYSSSRAMIESALDSFDPYSCPSIHDINGDGIVSISDAQCIMRFVKGSYTYNYDFQSLDVDNNYVINSADASTYLEFAVNLLSHPEINPAGFSSGSGSAPLSTNEERTYVKHDMINGRNPSVNDTVYTINSDGSVDIELNPWQNSSYHPMNMVNEETTEQYDSFLRTSLFSRIQDTRIIRCAGTGFIIGNHTILTNAHCVLSASGYNTTDVCAFTFTSNNEPIRHDLTVKSYYVPMAFIDTSYSNTSISFPDNWTKAYHDYAIIVVEEDLTSYGKFECGIPLENLANNTFITNTASYGFPQDTEGMCVVDRYRKYMVASYGGVDGIENGYWIRTTATEKSLTGMSGSPIVLNSIIDNSRTVSCDETVIGITRTGPSARGDIIVRPMLQFFYANEILETQVMSL